MLVILHRNRQPAEKCTGKYNLRQSSILFASPKSVAITAYALKSDREKCLEAEMNDYIAKPVEIEDTETALKDIRWL